MCCLCEVCVQEVSSCQEYAMELDESHAPSLPAQLREVCGVHITVPEVRHDGPYLKLEPDSIPQHYDSPGPETRNGLPPFRHYGSKPCLERHTTVSAIVVFTLATC